MTATYGYDNDDLLTSVASTGPTLTVVRNPTTGLPASMSVGVLSTSITPTAFGELAAINTTHTNTTTQAPHVYGNAYTYDNAGRIDTRTETVDGTSHVFDYDYDAAGRLDVVRRDSVIVEDYGYDANGNRESSVNFEGTSAATYDDQDRLLTYGDKAFTYNAHGQLTTMTHNGVTTTYVYDELDNLISVSRPGEPLIEYVIDGANRRVGRKVGGVLERGWLYLGQLEPVAEVNASGVVTATFIYGTMPHVPDLVVRGGVTYRVITDHLGSVRRVVNVATGAIAQSFEYDAWGNILASSGDMALQPFRFAGGLYDDATGFTRFGARDYDASVGRWTSKDPIGFGGGLALYGYSYNDPVSFVDVTGNNPLVIAGAIAGGVVGGVMAGYSAYQNGASGWGIAGNALYGMGKGAFIGAASGLGLGWAVGSAATVGFAEGFFRAELSCTEGGGSPEGSSFRSGAIQAARDAIGAGIGFGVGSAFTRTVGAPLLRSTYIGQHVVETMATATGALADAYLVNNGH